jgi:hypothetical protein
MKFYGDAHLQQNYLKEAVIPLDTFFPVIPKVGQIVFKDRILYICVEINSGLPTWVPLTNQLTAYTHIQSVDSSVWTVNHNMNTANVSVTVYDTTNRVVIPGEVNVMGSNQVVVNFGSPAQGKVVVLTGTQDGQQAPTYAFEFYQTNPSTSWVIPHGLGRYPIVRIFIGNQEVQPESITFNSLDQVTIAFSTPQVGQAKLI